MKGSSRVAFLRAVEEYVRLVSRMMRRASLALLYHLTRLADDGDMIPDLFNAKDTYWKNWLRLDGDHLPSDTLDRYFVHHDVATDTLQVRTRSSVVHHFEAIKAMLGGVPDSQPECFDQVLAYAATTLSTIVCNNAYVPLIPRLTRLTKTVVRSHGDDCGVRTFDLLQQIRSKAPDFSDLPQWAVDYATDIRARLKVPKGKCVHDEYGKTLSFHDLFMFNFWMQKELTRLGTKRLSLSPVIRVGRMHVRLDRKVLLNFLLKHCKDAKEVKAVVDLAKEHAKAQAETSDPDRLLPKLVLKRQEGMSDDEWAAHKKKVQEEHKLAVAQAKAQTWYVEQRARCDRRRSVETLAIQSMFESRSLRSNKSGWQFDCSLVTDGVAVSLQYSKQVFVPKTSAGSRTRKPPSEAAEEYDRHLSTMVTLKGVKTIVVGLDPGRANLATVAYTIGQEDREGFPPRDKKERVRLKDSWSLSRGQYYEDSNTKKMGRAQMRRYQELLEGFAQLKQGSVRTADYRDIERYLSLYVGMRDAWWDLALRRRESRDNLQRYSGKRSVLDGFFARVNKQLRKQFPGVKIEVAYGSAGEKMKPTGKGEVAVPTTGTYKSCKRVFGKDAVSVTNEFRTTLVDWETGEKKDAVYRKLTSRRNKVTGVERVRVELATQEAGKPMPIVPSREEGLMREYLEKREKRLAALRRGWNLEEEDGSSGSAAGNIPKKIRYPEVRGLRFCPERRIFLDRDRESAVAIARLRTLELQGQKRPAPFHPSFKFA